MTEALQTDRDAAAELHLVVAGNRSPFDHRCAEAIRAGRNDHWPIVQAFAAHRSAGQAELVEAAREVLSHRVGDLPTRGWLKDNDDSRASLAKLAAALQPLSQAGGGDRG